MGVPKRKPSKSRQRMRRAYNSVLKLPQVRCAGFRDRAVPVLQGSAIRTMGPEPVAAVRKKKDCSRVRAVELLTDAKADAGLSVGTARGIFAAPTCTHSRLPGLARGG